MIKLTDLVISQHVRTLYWKDSCVIGNIATDGRWVKIPTTAWERIINSINTTDFPVSSDVKTQNIIVCLYEIHVLIDKAEAINEAQFIIQPHDITLELTTQCNLKCKHCSYDFGGHNYEEMPFDTIIVLAKWCSEENVKRLILTGGEPFCRKDIIDIIKGIRAFYTGSLEIMTNATLIIKSNMTAITESIDRLHISLDGYDEESVSSIRGHHVFERVITAISELQAKNFTNISLSCVDTGDNQKIRNFNELAKRLHVRPIVRKLNMKGQASKTFFYENSDLFAPVSSNDTNMKSICHNTYSSLFINTHSQVFPCASLREMKYSIGTFSTEEHKFELNFASITPTVDKIGECSSCPVRYFCATPCISQNDVLYSNAEYRTKRCSRLREKLFHIIWE